MGQELELPVIHAVGPYRKMTERERSLQWVTEYLNSRTESVHFADHEGEVFNRAAAINNAVRLANPDPNDVLAIVDADCFITGKRFREGAEIARKTGRLVIPHNSVCRIRKADSVDVIVNRCPIKGPSGRWYRHCRTRRSVSGLVFLRFDSFLLINGFDESFVGWGGEDNAFKIAAETLLDGVKRLTGPLFHLWHKRQANRGNSDSLQYKKNRQRWLEYRNAAQVHVYEKTNESGFLGCSPYQLGEHLKFQ